jgi:hypothetical protein
MIVSELIAKLQAFPQDARVVIFPDRGWSDIDRVETVFGDFVALMDEDNFYHDGCYVKEDSND